MDTDYKPISCDFHDVLEALATTRRVASVRFRDGEGFIRHHRTSIVDIFSRSGSEYLVTESGKTLRLDQLVAVDGLEPGGVGAPASGGLKAA